MTKRKPGRPSMDLVRHNLSVTREQKGYLKCHPFPNSLIRSLLQSYIDGVINSKPASELISDHKSMDIKQQ